MPSLLRAALSGLVLVLAMTGCTRKGEPPPVLIGHVAPLSGPERLVGLHARQGIELAVAEAVAGDQTLEGRKFNVLHADGRGEAETAKAEAVRLVTVNKVAALLAGPDAARAERLGRAVQPYGVPVVVPGDLPGVPPGEDVFALGARPARRGEVLARYTARDLKARSVVVLTDSRDPVAAALSTAFVRGWPKERGVSIKGWSYAGEADHAALVKRTAEAKPEVVLIAGSPADFERWCELLDAAKAKVVLLYGGADVGPSTLAGGRRSGPAVYLATAYAEGGLTDRGKQFARGYEERFHEKPDGYAAAAYDAARFLFGAMQQAKSIKGDKVREQLAKQETFESVTGPVTWKDRQPRRRVFIVRLEAGSAKVLQTVEPEK